MTSRLAGDCGKADYGFGGVGMLDDLKDELGKFGFFLAVTVIPFLMIGKWIGFWWKDLIFIGSMWIFIAIFGGILKVAFEERFDMIWPILLGVAWVSVWWPMQHLAVEKAGFSDVFLDSSGNLPSYIELPWWSSLTFRLIILVLLVGAGYGISRCRSNR